MAELPRVWRSYAQLQTTLSRCTSVNNESWGMEAGLDALLAATSPSTDDDIVRVVNSTRKREYSRSRIRRLYLRPDDERPDPEGALLARSQLRRIRSQVPAKDWLLLQSLGLGYEYAELAKVAGSSAGAARIRVLRLRQQLIPKDAHTSNRARAA
jgi:hypothetical protein